MLKNIFSFKHWTTHLDEALLQFVVRFLCHEPGKRVSAVNGESFGRLYVYAVRGKPDERTSLVFMGYSEDEPKYEIPTMTFLQYLQATINSYLTLQKNVNVLFCVIYKTDDTIVNSPLIFPKWVTK